MPHNITTIQVLHYYKMRLDGNKHQLTSGREASVCCPFHDDATASMSINTGKGLWHCHAGCGGGNIIQFEMKSAKVDYRTAATTVANLIGVDPSSLIGAGQPEAVYPYVDEYNRYLFEKVRYPGKHIIHRKLTANGRYDKQLGFAEKKTRKVLYKLPQVITANEVMVLEGEKDCDNVNALKLGNSFIATTNHDGAGHWLPEYSPFFTGKKVAVFADNDTAGRKHAEMVAASVYPHALAVKVIHLPGLPEHGDVSDYLETHTAKDLLAEIENAPVWKPSDIIKDSTSVGVLLSEVQPESVQWLWMKRIPLGKVTLLEGDPGVGKSVMSLDIAARLTRGDVMPDGSSSIQGAVVLVNTEDGLADTIVPRLDAAGADRSLILAITEMPDGEYTRSFSLVDDLGALEEAIRKMNAVLVVIDPLMAFLGKVDSYKDQHVRAALSPIGRLAERTGAAILVVRHLTKEDKGKEIAAIYRGGGSIGIIGAARSAMVVGKDPHDKNASILAIVKANLAGQAPSLKFTKEEAANKSVKVVWHGEVDYSADELVKSVVSSDAAKELIRSFLADGPMPSTELQAAATAEGMSERTLARYRKELGVQAERVGGYGEDGKWMSSLPSKDCQDVQTLPALDDGNNGNEIERKPVAAVKPCYTCKGTVFWQRQDGSLACQDCHPDPSAKTV